jgi:predicted DNA-binding ribbon-helix-helix protein
MQSIFINGTTTSPSVYYSAYLNKIELKGRSITLEGDTFWEKLKQISDDLKKSDDTVQLVLNLEFINTLSVRNLAVFIRNLKQHMKNSIHLDVKWFYKLENRDLLDIAECISRATKTEFEYIGKFGNEDQIKKLIISN